MFYAMALVLFIGIVVQTCFGLDEALKGRE